MDEQHAVIASAARQTAEIAEETHRHQALRAIRIFALVFAGFTVVQAAYLMIWADPAVFNRSAALASVYLSIAVILVTVGVLGVNNLAKKTAGGPARIYRPSVGAYALIMLVFCWGQIHIAGSANSPLIFLIPTTAVVVSWLLGPNDSWRFLIVGTAGLLMLFALERIGLLTYFPLFVQRDQIPVEVFLDLRYLTIKMVIYGLVSVTVLHLLHLFQRDLLGRNEELFGLSKKLEVLATTDSLTGLLNRRTMMAHLERELSRAKRKTQPGVVVMADVDDFKKINDNHGHDAGDRVLVAVAQVFQESLRPYDLLARIGGEEFLFFIADLDPQRGRALVERTRQALSSRDIAMDGKQHLRITASFGCAAFDPMNPTSVNSLMRAADDALYASKSAGKNRVTMA